VVLRATDHQVTQQKAPRAVRTDVVAAWKKQRGVELAAAAAADAAKRLNADKSWDAGGEELRLTAQAPKFIRPIRSGCAHGNSYHRIYAPKPAQKNRFTKT